MAKNTLSKEEALSFILSDIIVTRGNNIELTPYLLFELMNLAGEAENMLSNDISLTPHEIIENLTSTFIETNL